MDVPRPSKIKIEQNDGATFHMDALLSLRGAKRGSVKAWQMRPLMNWQALVPKLFNNSSSRCPKKDHIENSITSFLLCSSRSLPIRYSVPRFMHLKGFVMVMAFSLLPRLPAKSFSIQEAQRKIFRSCSIFSEIHMTCGNILFLYTHQLAQTKLLSFAAWCFIPLWCGLQNSLSNGSGGYLFPLYYTLYAPRAFTPQLLLFQLCFKNLLGCWWLSIQSAI